MKVALLPKKTRGEGVNFTLSLHFADEKSAFGKQADGQFTGAMLMRGTTSKNRQELEDAFDKLRAHVSVGGNETGASASGKTFRKELPDTLRLVAQVLREPSFPARGTGDVQARARDRRSRMARIESAAGRRARIPPRRQPVPCRRSALFAHAGRGTCLVQAVTPESMRAFHSQFYGASNAELAIVGDFDPSRRCAHWSPSSSAAGRAPARTRACRIRSWPRSPTRSSSTSPTRPTRS